MFFTSCTSNSMDSNNPKSKDYKPIPNFFRGFYPGMTIEELEDVCNTSYNLVWKEEGPKKMEWYWPETREEEEGVVSLSSWSDKFGSSTEDKDSFEYKHNLTKYFHPTLPKQHGQLVVYESQEDYEIKNFEGTGVDCILHVSHIDGKAARIVLRSCTPYIRKEIDEILSVFHNYHRNIDGGGAFYYSNDTLKVEVHPYHKGSCAIIMEHIELYKKWNNLKDINQHINTPAIKSKYQK